METVEFPLGRAGVTRAEADLRRLTQLLRESALLLEACRVSSDSEFKAGSIDLAIKTMRAASVAMDRATPAAGHTHRNARVLPGPWAALAEPV